MFVTRVLKDNRAMRAKEVDAEARSPGSWALARQGWSGGTG